jgi:hypothetical protein
MAENALTRFRNAWNAFLGRDPTRSTPQYGMYGGTYYRPDRTQMSYGNDKSIITAIYNRIAIDVSNVVIRHVRVDENDQYQETIQSSLNNCLTLDANLDQTGKAFTQDLVMSLFDEGCVAVVPTDTSTNPKYTDSYDILTMRVGKIIEWYPRDVKVEVYNENTGKKEQIVCPKRTVAIIENPFYAIMNEPNSVLRRLIRKLVLLDAVDEQSSAGKLDLIIQLPYTIRNETRRKQAEERRENIEKQLAGSKYGIAYADATEHITQLNRPIENNLMKQIEYLTTLLYSQLGISETILNGTADEQTMLNYFNTTIEPILSAIVDEYKRKFLTKTARTQKQSIMFFREPFKLVPVNNIADIADKFTRNEILSSNEIRGIIGFRPSNDPKADELVNSNLNQKEDEPPAPEGEKPEPDLTEEQLE